MIDDALLRGLLIGLSASLHANRAWVTAEVERVQSIIFRAPVNGEPEYLSWLVELEMQQWKADQT